MQYSMVPKTSNNIICGVYCDFWGLFFSKALPQDGRGTTPPPPYLIIPALNSDFIHVPSLPLSQTNIVILRAPQLIINCCNDAGLHAEAKYCVDVCLQCIHVKKINPIADLYFTRIEKFQFQNLMCK